MYKKRKSIDFQFKYIILFLFLLGLISCDQDQIYHQYESIGEQGWGKDNIKTFEIPQLDSLQAYDVFISLRNNHKYPYSNLFLITTMNFPNGKEVVDTLEYRMAAASGSWLGSGFGDVKENKLWYKEGVRFRESGNYTLTITHAMRKNGNADGDQFLQGITEVGLRVEHPSK